ncbi:MAG: flagellar M-ring protein FliF [Pyrinomonadaceae bacterium]|nr:flagellar M-ring protein FliF [Pyrinomonadaceae bacterium]
MTILEQAKEIWNRLPMSGRITTIGAALATFGLVSAIIYYGSQPEYGALFSDLKPGDAQSIVEKLEASGVPYSLSNGGTTIQVPRDRLSELRLQMAGTGMLSGGHVGFDLFDKTSFGATDFAQKVNYRRAVEGELARTLEGMDEVEGARVHMTPKRESVFTEKEEGAKASVMLRVREGKELSSERTEAIASLVASSVEGLDSSNVSVMDTRGRLLTSGRGNQGSNDIFNSQLDSRRKFEAETAARIVSLLEPIAGDGRIRADVSADVDFSKTEETEEKYNPQSQVIRSQKTSEEKRNTSATSPGAPVVGVRSNDPATTQQTANRQNQTTGNDERVATTTNYEIDKTVRRKVGGGGEVKRMTVSVVVDHKLVNDVSTARTSEELKKFEELVGAAVGFNEDRGDSIVVQTMPFDKSGLAGETPAATFLESNKEIVSTAIKYSLLALATMLVLFFVIRPARKALAAASKNLASPQLAAAALGDGSDRRVISQQGNLLPGAGATVAELQAQMNEAEAGGNPSNSFVTNDSAQRLDTVKKMLIEENPEESEIVVGTLRGWLRE